MRPGSQTRGVVAAKVRGRTHASSCAARDIVISREAVVEMIITTRLDTRPPHVHLGHKLVSYFCTHEKSARGVITQNV